MIEWEEADTCGLDLLGVLRSLDSNVAIKYHTLLAARRTGKAQATSNTKEASS